MGKQNKGNKSSQQQGGKSNSAARGRSSKSGGKGYGGKDFGKEMKDIRNAAPRNKDARRAEEEVGSILKSQSNPISFYDRYPQFMKDAGTLSFSLPLGESAIFPSGDKVAMAGIMPLWFYPTIGISRDLNSPMNRGTLRFFTYLRDVQKAASNYDAADVGIYMVAQDSLHMFHAMLVRAYKTAQLFTPTNKYYPRALLQVQGFDLSILNNLAEFRAYINRFGLQLGRYFTPNGFEMTDRHQWMCTGLYLDSNTTRAQTYIFVPEGFWQYNNTVATGSQLDFVPWMAQSTQGLTLHTLADIQQIGDQLLSNVRNDQDTGRISGDLYAAYGPGKAKTVSEVRELDAILPVYDQTVLSQIENAIVTGVSKYDMVIKQDPSINNGAIIFDPYFGAIEAAAGGHYAHPLFHHAGQMMNMHWDSPTPDQVIEASRLVAAVAQPVPTNDQESGFKIDTCGTEVISRYGIACFNDSGSYNILYMYGNGVYVGGLSSSNSIESVADTLALSEQFDWSPLRYCWKFKDDATATEINITRVAGDVDNITRVSYEQIANMHEACLLSLLEVPEMFG